MLSKVGPRVVMGARVVQNASCGSRKNLSFALLCHYGRALDLSHLTCLACPGCETGISSYPRQLLRGKSAAPLRVSQCKNLEFR